MFVLRNPIARGPSNENAANKDIKSLVGGVSTWMRSVVIRSKGLFDLVSFNKTFQKTFVGNKSRKKNLIGYGLSTSCCYGGQN